MSTTIDDDLVVSGAISAANFQFGRVTITPEVNTPTGQEVTGLNLKGTGQVFTLLSAHSAYPWSRVQEVGQRFSSATGFTAYIYRTSGVDTSIHWFAIQEADLS